MVASELPRIAGVIAIAVLMTGCPVDDRILYEAKTVSSTQGTGGSSGSAGAPVDDSVAGASTAQSAAHTSESGSDVGGSGATASNGDGGGTGGSDSQPDDSNGGAGGSGGSGGSTGGGKGSSAEEVLGCSDLDEDQVADCDETLVENSRFADDLSGWEADPTAEIEWNDETASTGDDSGSIAVTNPMHSTETDGLLLTGAYQCIRVTESKDYLLYADMFVPDLDENAFGTVGVLFFDTNNCSGDLLRADTSRTTPTLDHWRPLDITATAPQDANSMKVRLGVVKKGGVPPVQVLFDNVLVRED